ncbi:MAG TPA: hypothetical protein VNA13_03900 [Xanthomonadales bacterium]|nr:hypothetical protein [Xanthomonadales bacterium]
MKTSGKTPVRFYREGQVFDANEFPAGTIIQTEEERLGLKGEGATNYRAEKFWGVLVPGIDGKIQQVRRYEEDLPFLGLADLTEVKVGEVEHHIWVRQDEVRGSLNRVTRLVVYEMGQDVKGKRERKFALPNLRVLFPKPQSGMA